MNEQPFHFGIYAGSVSGTATGLATGPADNLERIAAALNDLQPKDRPLFIRAYLHYRGESDWGSGQDLYSQEFRSLLGSSRKLDLVLCFHDTVGNVPGWLDCISEAIDQYGADITRLQITEEANLSFGTGAIDGDFPNVIDALAQGVVHAKRQLRLRNLAAQVGFSTAPSFGPGADFWTKLRATATEDFAASLDYTGFDFFPDVFRPVAPNGTPGDLRSSVTFLLEKFRGDLASVGITQNIPIVVTENGWPTGPSRSPERQSDVLETIVRTVHANRSVYNIAGYQWFALRDADSDCDDLFYRFGLLSSDYTPKPAFHVYRHLIDELGQW